MKQFGVLSLVAAVLLWTGVAAAAGEKGNVTGEIIKMEGDNLTVKTEDGQTKSIHVDPVETKKEGDLTLGARVEADVTPSGHANWIKVEQAAGSPPSGAEPSPDDQSSGGSMTGGPGGGSAGGAAGTMP